MHKFTKTILLINYLINKIEKKYIEKIICIIYNTWIGQNSKKNAEILLN